MEHWNSANSFIFYGKHGEVSTNEVAAQEVAILAMHLLQACLVYSQYPDGAGGVSGASLEQTDERGGLACLNAALLWACESVWAV